MSKLNWLWKLGLLIGWMSGVSIQAYNACWYPYAQINGELARYREGVEGIAFVPLFQSPQSLLFGEGALVGFSRSLGFTVGGGYRTFIGPSCAVGLGGAFDFGRSLVRKGHSFYQGTLCGEIYYGCWEARVNGYLPSGNCQTESKSYSIHETVNLDVITTTTTRIFDQVAYGGIDAELGYNLEFNCSRLRGWAGYYNYSTSGASTLQGPRLTIQAEFDHVLGWAGSRVMVGGMWDYDATRHHRTAIVLGVRVPLSWGCCQPTCCCLPSIKRRMGDPMRRRPGIYIRRIHRETVARNSMRQRIIFFAQNGMGPGTQTNPTNPISAQLFSDPQDVLFALEDNGPIDISTSPGSTFTLKDGQQLLGFDSHSSVVVTFPTGNSTTVVDLTGSGRAILEFPAGGVTNVVTLANGNRVDGLGIGNAATAASGGLNGIFGSGISNTVIGEMAIQRTSASGIYLINPTNTEIFSSTFDNLGLNGITTTGSEGTTIDGVTITTAAGSGISLTNSTHTKMMELSISGAGLDGVALLGTTVEAAISGTVQNTITNSGQHGLFVNNSTNTLISNLKVTNTGVEGVLLMAPTQAELVDVVVQGAGTHGVSMFNANTVAATQLTITNAGADGMHVVNPDTLAAQNVTIINPGSNGILFTGSTAQGIKLDTVTITNPGANGIQSNPLVSTDYTLVNCDVTLNSAATDNIQLLNLTNLQMTGGRLINSGGGGRILEVTGQGNYSISNLYARKDLAMVAFSAIDIEVVNPVGPIEIDGLDMSENTIDVAPFNGAALFVVSSGGTNPVAHFIRNVNIFKPGSRGIVAGSVDTDGDSWDISFNTVSGDVSSNISQAGISFGRSNATVGVGTTRLTMFSDVVTRVEGTGFVVQLNGALSGSLFALLENNTTNFVNGLGATAFNAENAAANAGATLAATIQFNGDLVNSGSFGYTGGSNNLGKACIDMTSNGTDIPNPETAYKIVRVGLGPVTSPTTTPTQLQAANPGNALVQYVVDPGVTSGVCQLP